MEQIFDHNSEPTFIDIKDVRPNPKNRNVHSEEQISRLVELLKYQGWRHPLIISNQSGQLVVGHGRLAAAKKLKMKTVPVVYQDFDSPEQEYAFAVSDNAIASWSDLDLSGINTDVGELGPDFNLDLLGIENFTLDVVEKVPPGGDPDENTVSMPVEPKSKLGDLWTLGDHRLFCGDATDVGAVDRLMEAERADMVFTDPPYNTGMGVDKKRSGSAWLSHMFNDSFTDEEWEALLSGMVASYWMLMKDNSIAYVCLDWRRSHELVPQFKKTFHFSNLIVWDKVVHGLGSDYKYTHEFIHVFKKGKPELDTHQGEQEYQDIWHVQRKMGRDDEHATKKPIELIERAMGHASKRGDIVADLFGGSGSTLLAAEKAGRRCFMMELDPRYIDVILTRWAKYTGLDPVRDDGTAWSTL
jgi:DNA modification methylase